MNKSEFSPELASQAVWHCLQLIKEELPDGHGAIDALAESLHAVADLGDEAKAMFMVSVLIGRKARAKGTVLAEAEMERILTWQQNFFHTAELLLLVTTGAAAIEWPKGADEPSFRVTDICAKRFETLQAAKI